MNWRKSFDYYVYFSFVMFDQYHIPHDALLNKYANVSEDGTYTTPLRNPKSRTGKSLGALSTGRINITTCCTISLNNSVTIAIRYAAVRKQFSDAKTKEEIPILEYQSLVKPITKAPHPFHYRYMF